MVLSNDIQSILLDMHLFHIPSQLFYTFFLTSCEKYLNIVNTMNISKSKKSGLLLAFQTERLQTILDEIYHCCEARMLLESHKFDLLQSELRCLMFFMGERYLTAKDIALKMNVAKSRVTLIMEGLVRKELVQRDEDPKDGRVKLLSLTPKGRRITDEIDAFLKGVHEQILLFMKPAERKTILSSLELLRASMEMVKAQME